MSSKFKWKKRESFRREKIIRFVQGGNNAGHSVVVNGVEYDFHMLPSGFHLENCTNIIGKKFQSNFLSIIYVFILQATVVSSIYLNFLKKSRKTNRAVCRIGQVDY